MLMTLLNKFGDCSEHSWFDTVPTAGGGGHLLLSLLFGKEIET